MRAALDGAGEVVGAAIGEEQVATVPGERPLLVVPLPTRLTPAAALVALARARDPDLGDALWLELAGTRRLAPADIDRILTRIEDVRDRS